MEDNDVVAFTAVELITDDVIAYAADIPKSSANTSWIFDSGASKHMSGNIKDFISLQPRHNIITVAGGARLPVDDVGTVELDLALPDGSTHKAQLTNVLYSY